MERGDLISAPLCSSEKHVSIVLLLLGARPSPPAILLRSISSPILMTGGKPARLL